MRRVLPFLLIVLLAICAIAQENLLMVMPTILTTLGGVAPVYTNGYYIHRLTNGAVATVLTAE